MFPREWRLTRARDVQKVYKKGASAASHWLLVRSLPHRGTNPRLTVIIGKKAAKKAVERNRLKRLVRQSVQDLLKDGKLGVLNQADTIITIHRTPPEPYTLEAAKAEVVKCFDRLPLA